MSTEDSPKPLWRCAGRYHAKNRNLCHAIMPPEVNAGARRETYRSITFKEDKEGAESNQYASLHEVTLVWKDREIDSIKHNCGF